MLYAGQYDLKPNSLKFKDVARHEALANAIGDLGSMQRGTQQKLGCIADLLMAIFAWPLFATYNVTVFAIAEKRFGAKRPTLLTFVPVLIITTGLWAACWALALWLLARIG